VATESGAVGQGLASPEVDAGGGEAADASARHASSAPTERGGSSDADQRRHLLELAPLSKRREITALLDLAESFQDISQRRIKKVPALRGMTVVLLFLEASTRTRTSFELAAKRLSADTLSIAGGTSSVVKGETLLDTARNLAAMSPDIIVLRHKHSGAPAPARAVPRREHRERRGRGSRAPDAGAAGRL
jgi:hypothetical protein